MTSTRFARSSIERSLIASLFVLASILLTGCEGHHHGHGYHDDWAISIDNRTGVTLDIYLDGRYRLTVTGRTIGTIPGVPEGDHGLEAFDLDGHLRASRGLYLHSEFVWVLD